MDDLKKYVEANRDEYELYEVPADLWNQIEVGLDNQKPKKSRPIWTWSAVAIVSALGLVLGIIGFSSQKKTEINSPIPSELVAVEGYYQDLIAIKVNQISAIEPDQSIFEDIDLLDVAFTELKEDLKDNADNEEVINAMIANYQVKLKILERVLEELKRKKEIK